MWQFEHINHLWWLLLIPAMALLWRFLDKRQEDRLNQNGQADRIRQLLLHFSPERRKKQRILLVLAIFFLVLAYANPQSGKKETIVRSTGADVVFALDLSNSMMANDLSPNRLEVAKKFIRNMSAQLAGDRVALIAFAGNAYPQLPFTTDYGALDLYLSNLTTDLITKQGTAIGDAITTALSMPGVNASSKGKVLVVLSDGEDHDSQALANAEKAGKEGLTIFTIGVGTIAGGNIPERNEFGSIDFKRDRQGEIVWSKLNEEMMKNLAKAGNGNYYNVAEGKKAVKDIIRKIRLASNITAQEKKYRDFNHYFRIPLLLAILLLLAEWLYFPAWWSYVKGKKPTLILLLAGILLISCEKWKAAPGHEFNQTALMAFDSKEYDKAIQEFKKALAKDTANASYYFNIANAFYAKGEIDSALVWMENALKKTNLQDTSMQSAIAYNLGCFFHTDPKLSDAAIESYRHSLKLQPGRFKAQHNLSMLLKKEDNQDQPEDKKNEQKQEDKEQQEQKKDKEQEDKEQQEKNKKEQEQNKDSKEEQGKKDKEKPQPQNAEEKSGKKARLNPMQVQQLLEMLKQEEKAVQRKLMERNAEHNEQEYEEKDW